MADGVTSPRGAEISERSVELVLPDDDAGATPLRKRREFGVSESEGTTAQILRERAKDARSPGASGGTAREEAAARSSAALASRLTKPAGGTTASASTKPSNTPSSPPRTGPSEANAPPPEPRGFALPGDRGPRNQSAQNQRPSFWRRLALGRRSRTPDTAAHVAPPDPQTRPPVPAAPERPTLTQRAKSAVAPTPAIDTKSIETVIVEPMLQALVSVEAKLERSHTELVGRSDSVEQRLTQLWEIEEQLSALGELQDSLLQVSEQQRRLESAVVAQTTTLRWLVGAVFVSLAGAAFVVAAVLR